MNLSLLPENMLNLYAQGAFPMADEEDIIDWYFPETRCIIDVNSYNYPRTLRKFDENSNFEFQYSTRVMDVIKCCSNRKETWINKELINAYKKLYELGHVHSVEVFLGKNLVGGLYGITILGAFFGESMFSTVPQASKSALIKLLERLRERNFIFVDVQYPTEHLAMFGTKEITIDEYYGYLQRAYEIETNFI